MSDTPTPADRRAQTACITGLVIQLLLFGAVLAVGLWAGKSDAILAGARHLLGGVPIWIILFIVFTQRKRSRIENLETEQLRRAQQTGQTTHMFDVGDESMLLERRRLMWTYKFLMPTFTVIILGYHILGAFVLWPWKLGQSPSDTGWRLAPEPFVPMLFAGGVAFACFIYARYVVGMARQRQWRMLRAGGNYLMGNALTMALLLLTLAFSGGSKAPTLFEPIAAHVIRIVMLLLGVEFTINFILEFYRPRQADEDIRPAFDSRLLSLFSEPGGVVRSIAETINYQFGFEVSGTWFYQLIQRSIFPLAMLTVASLFLLSSVVVIDVDEQAVVERWGRRVQSDDEVLSAGFHLKMPWPIDRVVRERVAHVRSLIVGEDHAESQDQHAEEPEGEHAILWTEEHNFNPESMMVVANSDAQGVTLESSDSAITGTRSRSVSVNLLMISMPIEYRIKNLDDFVYRYRDPERVLETVAYQELSDYVSGVDIDRLMGPGRIQFNERMKLLLQERCDALALGIEITNLTLQDAHPPSQGNVAATFQEVVSAEIKKAAAIEMARGDADLILTRVAGGVERARALDEAIKASNTLADEQDRDPTPQHREAADKAASRVSELLLGDASHGIAPASGNVAGVVSAARGERESMIAQAESKSRTFLNDLAAYRAAPSLYRARAYLDLLRRTLPNLRKYVLTFPDRGNVMIEYNAEEPGTLDLETAAPQ